MGQVNHYLDKDKYKICLIAGMALPLGESDPQFSSPRRTVIFEDEGGSDPYKRAAIDSRSESDIDPALLQAVLSDPILLQAVDPLVLQAVLVSAAAANLARPNIYSQPQPAAAPAVSHPIVFPAAAQASRDSFPLDSPTAAQASHGNFIMNSPAYTLPQLVNEEARAQQVNRNTEYSHNNDDRDMNTRKHLPLKRLNLHFEDQQIPPSKKRVKTEIESFLPINLPTPTYGSPDPLITHIGAPLPPGALRRLSANMERNTSERQPAIQFE